jgi:hypothetical protein
MVFINGGKGLKLLKENSEIFYNFYTNFIEKKPELINFYIGCIKDMMKNDLTDNEQEQSCLARFNIATLFSNLKSQKSDQESEFFTVLKQHSDELNNNKYFLLSSSDKLVWKVLNDLFFLDAKKEDKEKIKNMTLDKIFIKNKLDYFLRIFNESNTYNEFAQKLNKDTLFSLETLVENFAINSQSAQASLATWPLGLNVEFQEIFKNFKAQWKKILSLH